MRPALPTVLISAPQPSLPFGPPCCDCRLHRIEKNTEKGLSVHTVPRTTIKILFETVLDVKVLNELQRQIRSKWV
jgi:hypothetical protein